ncbi:predicted protein [Nematostella vectensis]|uniref:DRBM domain-containing protein n=1 Tax=Nematostella vectensis TaxID=45351 RepID=A7S1J6_NEMVE|nr:predicted protein [Nematostella vectensis]|eukprot:XP_001634398.1 predicted protein [Nematostella vectensis]
MAYTYGALPPPQGTPVEEETKLIGPTPVAPQPKTPISELLELAVQMGIKVDFEQVSAVGMPHNQTFTINCKAGDFTGIGTGPSKKKAKQNAASATLEKIKKSLDFKDHLFVSRLLITV